MSEKATEVVMGLEHRSYKVLLGLFSLNRRSSGETWLSRLPERMVEPGGGQPLLPSE